MISKSNLRELHISHVLVIGGTGMLRGVSLHLASQGNSVSVISRDPHRIKRLAEEARSFAGNIYPLQIDYRDGEALGKKLEEAIATLGSITLIVSWIHSTAPEAPELVAGVVCRGPSLCRYFDIWGFATEDPWYLEREKNFQKLKSILYRKVVLGFVVEGVSSRWLTNEEISLGVIKAIVKDEAYSVVGRIHPKSAQP